MPSTIQSALHPAGQQAAHIAGLWWLMLWVCTAVFVAVMIGLAVAVARGRSKGPRAGEATLTRGVAGAVGLSVVALVGLLFASVLTGRAVGSLTDPAPLAIRVTANQWWWAVEYQNPVAALNVTTADEIHLPVGRPTAITLVSSDVIHSFWVPNLHGKIDLVPGRVNTIWIKADTAGVYRGQCAEYCGLQHAHMAFTVVAEPAAQFEGWLAAQRAPARAPAGDDPARGKELVEQGTCALCHTIRGTSAGAVTGPDLTHIASRPTIAAGTLPNTPEHLALWIADPQAVKPGNRMPATGLSPADLRAVVAYLETLR
jgi:cytochrome c oxidase subunit II